MSVTHFSSQNLLFTVYTLTYWGSRRAQCVPYHLLEWGVLE